MAGQGLARTAIAASRVIGPLVSKGGKRVAKEAGKHSKAGKEAGSNGISNVGGYVDDPRRPFQTGNEVIDGVGNFIFGDHTPTNEDFEPGGRFNSDHPAPGPGDEGEPPSGGGKDGKGSKASIAAARELQNQQNLPNGRQDFLDISSSSWPMF